MLPNQESPPAPPFPFVTAKPPFPTVTAYAIGLSPVTNFSLNAPPPPPPPPSALVLLPPPAPPPPQHCTVICEIPIGQFQVVLAL